jgi:hypothetical protein
MFGGVDVCEPLLSLIPFLLDSPVDMMDTHTHLLLVRVVICAIRDTSLLIHMTLCAWS